MDDESRHAGVLANGSGVFLRHVDVGSDNSQRLGRLRAGDLGFQSYAHGGADIGGQVGGSLRDQLDQAVFKKRHQF